MGRLLPLRRFVVADTSMRPTLQPGDRLFVFLWPAPKPGDLVVLREPGAHLTFAVKRVARLEPNGDVIALFIGVCLPNRADGSDRAPLVPSGTFAGNGAVTFRPQWDPFGAD